MTTPTTPTIVGKKAQRIALAFANAGLEPRVTVEITDEEPGRPPERETRFEVFDRLLTAHLVVVVWSGVRLFAKRETERVYASTWNQRGGPTQVRPRWLGHEIHEWGNAKRRRPKDFPPVKDLPPVGEW